jgi:methyl-accepting chemotaxis protein
MTWLPFLPVAAAYSFLGTPWWICTPAAGVIGAGIAAWWKRRWSSLRDTAHIEALTAWLEQENKRLNAALQDVCARISWERLRQAGRDADAADITPSFLADTLQKKKLIESKILGDSILTDDEEDLSSLVSDLFNNVLQELERLASPDAGATAGGAFHAIASACHTIRQTAEEVEQLIDPLADIGVPELRPAARSIERNTERLRERMQQAAAIKRRITESIQSTDARDNGPSVREDKLAG